MQHFAPVLQVTSRAKMAAMVTVHFARNYYVEKIPEVLIYLLIHVFTKIRKENVQSILFYRYLECWETR